MQLFDKQFAINRSAAKMQRPVMFYMIKSTLKIGAFVLMIVAVSGIFYMISNHMVVGIKP